VISDRSCFLDPQRLSAFTDPCSLIPVPCFLNLAGAEGFEPPSSVLETDSLTVELTPLFQGSVISG
jgi:hypothetical protein